MDKFSREALKSTGEAVAKKAADEGARALGDAFMKQKRWPRLAKFAKWFRKTFRGEEK
jgi:hypothetical protein